MKNRVQKWMSSARARRAVTMIRVRFHVQYTKRKRSYTIRNISGPTAGFGGNRMRWWPVALLLMVSAIWGGHAVVGKTLEQQWSPLDLTVWRFTLGAVCYAPLYPGLIRRIFRLPGRTFWQLALTGLLWAVLYPVFFYGSLRLVTPAESLLLINSSPLFAALFGRLLLGERLAPVQGIGMAISFAGVVWAAAGQWEARSSALGVALAVMAAGAFAAYTVSSRSLSRKLSMPDMVAATSLWGAIDCWIAAAAAGRAGEMAGALRSLNGEGWQELLYVVVIVNTVSYFLYAYALRRSSAAMCSALTFYPQFVFAALFQWIWLSIEPSAGVIASACLVLGGMAVMNLSVGRKRNRNRSVAADS